jgi:hypothetical protein
MTFSTGRACVILGAASFAAASLLLGGCGGGTDIAPSDPIIEGQGFAAGALGSRDFGESSQVDAGVASVQASAATATNEAVTIRADGYGVLAHGLLSSPIVTLTGPGGVPTYCQGLTAACAGTPTCGVPPTIPCDFWLADAGAGLIQVSPTGTIAPGSTVEADYSYNSRLLTIDIGVTFPSGQFLTILVYHVPSVVSLPLDLTQTVSSPPSAPYPMAFSVILQTNLTTSGSREILTSIDTPGNLLHFTRLDLSNEGEPCLEGTLNVTVDASPTPLVVTASFRTPGC